MSAHGSQSTDAENARAPLPVRDRSAPVSKSSQGSLQSVANDGDRTGSSGPGSNDPLTRSRKGKPTSL